MLTRAEFITPRQKKNQNKPVTIRSGKKRVLFPTDTPPVEDLSDLRFLSSPENISSPEHATCSSSSDEDLFGGYGETHISPTIHRGIENLLTPSTSVCSTNEDNRDSEFVLEKTTFVGYGKTPAIPVTNDCLEAPVKHVSDVASEETKDVSAEVGLKTSTFYGPNRPTMDLIRKIRLSRLTDHSKVKAKLFSDDTKKRSRSSSEGGSRRSKHSYPKNKPALFTGVGHGIKKSKPKPKPNKSAPKKDKNLPIRKRLRKEFDLSRVPRTSKQDPYWDYLSLIKKPERHINKNEEQNRKFFKSHASSGQTLGMKRSLSDEELSVPKKAKVKQTGNTDFNDTLDLLELLEDDINDDPGIEENVKNIIETLDINMEDSQPMVPYITKEAAQIEDYKQQLNCVSSYLKPVVLCVANEISVGLEQGHGTSNVASSTSPSENDTDVKEDTVVKSKPQMLNNESSPINNSSQKYYPIFTKKYSPTFSTPAALKDVTNSKRLNRLQKAVADTDQYQLDAGQKKFGAIECKICKMVYYAADPKDEQRHAQYHNSRDVLKYKTWKAEVVVGYNGMDRIILVHSSSTKAHIQKVMSVIKYTENEMGMSAMISSSWKAFLYIQGELIVGCLIAEPLTQAYRVAKNNDILMQFEDAHKVRCGINRIWTKSDFRRQGIATSLINCLRKNYVYGEILKIDDIAFSATTNDGHLFAQKYTGREDYLIYTGT